MADASKDDDVLLFDDSESSEDDDVNGGWDDEEDEEQVNEMLNPKCIICLDQFSDTTFTLPPAIWSFAVNVLSNAKKQLKKMMTISSVVFVEDLSTNTSKYSSDKRFPFFVVLFFV